MDQREVPELVAKFAAYAAAQKIKETIRRSMKLLDEVLRRGGRGSVVLVKVGPGSPPDISWTATGGRDVKRDAHKALITRRVFDGYFPIGTLHVGEDEQWRSGIWPQLVSEEFRDEYLTFAPRELHIVACMMQGKDVGGEYSVTPVTREEMSFAGLA